MSCGVGGRCSLDLVVLWLWHRPAAEAPTGPLAQESPYAEGMALKRQKDKKTKKQKNYNEMPFRKLLMPLLMDSDAHVSHPQTPRSFIF